MHCRLFRPVTVFCFTIWCGICSVINLSLAADSTLDWSSRPATNLETGGTDAASIDGITVTTSGTITGSRTSDTLTIAPTTTLNGYSGVISSALNATIDNETVFNTVNFSFSEPVYDLRFRLIDVDGFNSGGSRFSDLIVYGSSAGVPSSGSAGANVTYTLATGRALENATANCSGTDPNCEVDVVYDGPITSASVQHVAADAAGGSDPTNQAVQIFDLTFNTAPDATNNTASTFVGGSVSGNVISDNDGFGADSDRQDGANLLVNQISHPDGTLAVGGGGVTLNLLNGAGLTIAQDGSYTFNTNGAYVGLAPGASTTETFTYRVEDLEGLFNTNGDTPNPDSVATLIVTISNTPSPSFTINKIVDQASISSPGTLTYTITVDNTGNVDLTGTSLSDVLTQNGLVLTLTTGPTLSGDSDLDGELDVAETWVYSATFDVSQTELDDGNDIINVATFDTNETTSQFDSAQTATPGVVFTCAGDNFAAANNISGISGTTDCNNVGATGESGEPLTFGGGSLNTIWYNWTAPATGTATFDTCDTSFTSYDTTLGVFAGSAVSALTTVVRNDDGPGCAAFSSLLSFAAVSGTTYRIQVGGYANGTGNFRLRWNMTAPLATIAKSVNLTSISSTDSLSYTIVVDNTGNVDLTSPTLVDVLDQNGSTQTLTSGPTLSGDADGDGILDTSETWIYAATYDVVQANVDDGNDLVNTATFNSAETTAIQDAATTTITTNPSISVTKSADDTTDVTLGQVITYTYVVTNDGNQTISNIDLADVHGGSGPASTPGGEVISNDAAPLLDWSDAAVDGVWDSLPPGDSVTFTGTYTVTQNDIDTLQ